MTSISRRPLALTVLGLLMLGPVACRPGEPSDGASPARPAAAPAAPPPASAPAAPTSAEAVVTDAVATAEGTALYARHCASCHGATGLGDGAMAKMLNPPPRGLVDEPWRYVDASSAESLRTSMATLLRTGMPDKMMPGLAGVATDEEIAAVVEFVLSLRK